MEYGFTLQAFHFGDAQKVRSADIIKCFDGFIKEQGPECVELQFGKKTGFVLCLTPAMEYVDIFSIKGPAMDADLAGCIFKVMGLGNFVLYEDDGKYPLVNSSLVLDHLPEDLMSVLGDPVVAGEMESFKTRFAEMR